MLPVPFVAPAAAAVPAFCFPPAKDDDDEEDEEEDEVEEEEEEPMTKTWSTNACMMLRALTMNSVLD